MNAARVITGILGAVLGTAGITISILTYLRDKPTLNVTLLWDMREVQHGVVMGLVKVANIGRRPVHVGIVALVLPPNEEHEYLILSDSIKGQRLDEGDKPAGFMVKYDGLAKYKNEWNKIRAMAEDSAAKKYYSDFPKKKLSWAN